MADIRPLTDLSRRFPQPGKRSDILMTYPLGTLTHEEIFLFLTDSKSEHWQHKYDWKSYLRLLAVNDWVFKTSEWHRSEALYSVQKKIYAWKERSQKINVWHPKKYWFILHHGDYYWACNATPRLMTLAEVGGAYPQISNLRHIELKAKRGWLLLWTLCRFGVLLDFKETNFVVDQELRRVYYIDDELYVFDSWRDFLRGKQRPLS